MEFLGARQQNTQNENQFVSYWLIVFGQWGKFKKFSKNAFECSERQRWKDEATEREIESGADGRKAAN